MTGTFLAIVVLAAWSFEARADENEPTSATGFRQGAALEVGTGFHGGMSFAEVGMSLPELITNFRVGFGAIGESAATWATFSDQQTLEPTSLATLFEEPLLVVDVEPGEPFTLDDMAESALPPAKETLGGIVEAADAVMEQWIGWARSPGRRAELAREAKQATAKCLVSVDCSAKQFPVYESFEYMVANLEARAAVLRGVDVKADPYSAARALLAFIHTAVVEKSLTQQEVRRAGVVAAQLGELGERIVQERDREHYALACLALEAADAWDTRLGDSPGAYQASLVELETQAASRFARIMALDAVQQAVEFERLAREAPTNGETERRLMAVRQSSSS